MESVCKGISGGMYSSLIVHNPDPIFLLDHIGNIVDVNLAVVDVFGYSTAELKEFSYQDIVTPKFVSELQHSLCKTLQGESCSYHVSAYRKNGEILHLDVKNIPIFDDYQKLINVMIVTKDITDLVQTKAALQETSERLHSIYDSSADAMDIIDLNGNVQKVNKAFEEMYGWKAEEIIGKPMPTILNDRLEMVQTERKKVMNHQYIKGLEVECLRKDGSRIPVSITISPLRDEQGNVIAFAGISRDMSERKKWEEELIRSEEKYRLIAENMTDLVTVVDENGVITYASPSTAPVLGFSPEEYVGIQAFSKAHPEDYPSVDQKVMALFQTKDSCEMEFRYQHNTKDWIWLEAKGTYFIDEKQGQGFALFVSRVIEEKRGYGKS